MSISIPIKVTKDFEKAYKFVDDKYGEDFELLNGFHESQLNYSDFIDGFVDKNVADVTIDGNANAHHKDVCSLLGEKGKSEDKLFAFNKIFYELKKKYGLRTAKEWLENEWSGAYYLHDAPSSTYKPYCYAYDLTRLAKEGLFFLEGYNNQAPNHLTTFLDDVIEFVSFMSNRSSGACGLPNVLLWTFYFWKKDIKDGYCIKDADYYIRQSFQKFIYRLNQPFLRVDQSAFVNVSIFDKYYLESLFGGVEFPDGTFAIDYIDEIMEHQKIFMEVVSEIRSSNMFTFPVLSYSLLKRDDISQDEKDEMRKTHNWKVFKDNDFAKWCSDHNCDWNDSNFFQSDNVGVLSNCCFDGQQKILAKSSSGVIYCSFKELYDMPYEKKKNFTIFHNGSWVGGKLIKLPKRKMYKITTSNKKELYVTDNHVFPTFEGDKEVKDLTDSDYIMFSSGQLDTFPEKDKGLTYEEGFLIGMYLGDGSIYIRKENYTPEINLSLNENKYNDSKEIIFRALKIIDSDAKYILYKPYNNVYPTMITSWKVNNFIREYVSGGYCYDKELNMDCLLQSHEFRQGILDGYYETDGENSNRIYTTSKNLVGEIECLITSLGLNSIIDVSDRTDEAVIIREQSFKRNYPLYCIRWYNPMNKRTLKNIFKVKVKFKYFNS